MPWLFILPITLLHLAVVIGPSIVGLYYALTDWSGVGEATFIGLDNFASLLGDPNFSLAMGNNLLWMAFFLIIPPIMALAAASLLAQVRRGAMAYRTVLFVPYVLPSVVAASIWQMLLNARLGVGAQLAKLGVEFLDHPWLGDPRTALWAIAFADNWHWWGFLMTLFLTAMQAISPELYDAAKIDGANRLQEFLHVTLPGIRPTVTFMLTMTAVWSFLNFDYVWLMTQGGPAHGSELLSTFIYKQGFRRFEFGYATAAGLAVSVIAAIIIGLFALLRRRGWDV